MTKQIDLKDLSNYDENGFFRPEKLALVHVTSYMPQKTDGHYEIQSTAEATDYIYPRNTIHFTIGHHVDAVFGGNWNEMGIMIVASLKDTIDDNNKPLQMSSFDTYFETTPGHNLKLPKGTHIFIPTANLRKLDGKLSKTEGDITYYKATNYTDAEKKDIFSEVLYQQVRFSRNRGTYIGDEYFEESQYKKIPNENLQLALKKILLDRYLEQKGFVKNGYDSTYHFNSEGSDYATAVMELGEKLGCRFCTAGNKGHFYNDFSSETTISELFNLMQYAHFVLHPDKFEIIDARTIHKSRKYKFRKKDGKGLPIEIWGSQMEENHIETLKAAPDFTKEMLDIQKESGDKWSPAYKKTYDMWVKKTKQRLDHYYAEAKNYSFDQAWEKIQGMMKEFDQYHQKIGENTLLSKRLEELHRASSEERKKRETAIKDAVGGLKGKAKLKVLRETDVQAIRDRESRLRGKRLAELLKDKTAAK